MEKCEMQSVGKKLTFSEATSFGLFQTERISDNTFKFDENGRKFFNRSENTVRKGEIARY